MAVKTRIPGVTVPFRKKSIYRQPGLPKYVDKCTSPSADELVELIEATDAAIPLMWNIRVSRVQAMFLEFWVAATRARTVLEVGAFTGVSTLAIARRLPKGGSVTTCDNFIVDPKTEAIFRRAVAASPHGHKVRLVVGDAIDVLAKVKGPFDLIFLDADKPNYIRYLKLILRRGLLAPGGTIIVDNTLWGGLVVDDPPAEASSWVDEWTQDVLEFNHAVLGYPDLEVLLLPVFDGMTFIRRRRSSLLERLRWFSRRIAGRLHMVLPRRNHAGRRVDTEGSEPTT